MTGFSPGAPFTTSPKSAACVVMLCGLMLAACNNESTKTLEVAAQDPETDEREHAEAHWGYENENGPASWGSMRSEWTLCADGRRQSPVDLGSSTEKALPATTLHTLSAHAVEVINQDEVLEELDNGHTLQVNAFLPDALQIGDKSYSLRQFHFHAPSEHSVNGEHFPMEIHFVNEAEDGSLAVFGVLVRVGAANPAIDSLWESVPQARGESNRTRLPEAFAENVLYGAVDGLFHYTGSLTTPPCTEGVQWVIKRTPTELSADQIQRFQAIYDHNNRPTQPLYDRDLYLDSSPDIRLYSDAAGLVAIPD